MIVHDEFIQAMRDLRLCVLKDVKGNSRLVQPYGVFLTRQNKPMYCCFQVGGYSGSGEIPNWRNVSITEIKEVTITERGFKKRSDYNPDNRDLYYQWIERI